MERVCKVKCADIETSVNQGADIMKNVAYSEEYLTSRRANDWLLELKPSGEKCIPLGTDGRYCAQCTTFSHEQTRADGILIRSSASKVRIMGGNGRAIYEYTVTDDHLLLSLVEHQNEQEYLLFNIDLYGYSVLKLGTGEAVHYIPEKSFRGGETFIWVDAIYCKVSNLLVANGCYWAAPSGIEVYDFSDPMSLPLPMHCDSSMLGRTGGISTDDDIEAVAFNDGGACIIRGSYHDGSFEKTIDFLEGCKLSSMG